MESIILNALHINLNLLAVGRRINLLFHNCVLKMTEID